MTSLGPTARAWADERIAAGEPFDVARLGAWSFGDTAELADQLAALVVAGHKRAPAGLLAESEGDATLESWRRDHRVYFTRECAALGVEPTAEMPVVCTELRLVRART